MNRDDLTINISVINEPPYFELVVAADGYQARRFLAKNSRLERHGRYIASVRHGNDCVQFIIIQRGFELPKFKLHILVAD